MTRLRMMICLLALVACAAPKSGTKLDRQVTRIDGAAANEVESAVAPSVSTPQVDAAVPGPGWLMKRETRPLEDSAPASIMLINTASDVQAIVAVFLKPSVSTPKEMAESQRESLIKLGLTCSRVTVSKDGSRAGFTTKMKIPSGKLRMGKTVYFFRQNRKDCTVALFAVWNARSNKAMLSAADKIISSITVK